MKQVKRPAVCCKLACSLFFFIMFGTSIKLNAQIVFSSYSSNGASIDNFTEANSGKTISNNLTLGLNISNPGYRAGWNVKVRVNGDLSNGVNSIPSQYLSLKFESSDVKGGGITGPQVPLTPTDATLFSSTKVLSDYYLAATFKLIVQGGNHLMVPNTGVYSTTITVSFYTNTGVLIASNNDIPIKLTFNFSNGCSGMIVEGSNNVAYNFDTYEKLNAGGTAVDALTVQYNPYGATCSGWSLKVRAKGNFVNGSSSISPDHVSFRFNRVGQGNPTASAIGVSNAQFRLGMSDVTLINQSKAPFANFTSHFFDMIIDGGNYLVAAKNGTYSCPITLSLYNQAGQLVSSSDVTVSFLITTGSSYNYTITLLNPDVKMQFNTMQDYASGKSVTKSRGLKIVGYSAYQVIVKTIEPNLISGTNTIPVSVVRLTNNPVVARSGIISTPVQLSSSDQVIIRNSLPDYTYQTTEYDLNYAISGGNSAVLSSNTGAYSTQVIYIVLPL